MTTWQPGDVLLLPELKQGSRLWIVIDIEPSELGDTIIIVLESMTKPLTCKMPLELINQLTAQILPSHDKMPPTSTHSELLKLAIIHGWQGDTNPMLWVENLIANYERLLHNA